VAPLVSCRWETFYRVLRNPVFRDLSPTRAPTGTMVTVLGLHGLGSSQLRGWVPPAKPVCRMKDVNVGYLPSTSTIANHRKLCPHQMSSPGITLDTVALVQDMQTLMMDAGAQHVVLVCDGVLIKSGIVHRGGVIYGLIDGPQIAAELKVRGCHPNWGRTCRIAPSHHRPLTISGLPDKPIVVRPVQTDAAP
jgi:hypothetical protein